ncbi:hypothetical protein ACQKFK_17775 [Bacillus mycoides]|uniref:hypothetical protein n=1 Tax=Bacillus mycoides TaxID=1405 RepID=UPI003D06C3F8
MRKLDLHITPKNSTYGRNYRNDENENKVRTMEVVNGNADFFQQSMQEQGDEFNKLVDHQNSRIDNLVVAAGGDDITEVVDARVDSNGNAHPLLGNRLAFEMKKTEENFKSVNSRIEDISASVKNAGLDDTGKEDCSQKFITFLIMTDVNKQVIFPRGTYLFENIDPIKLFARQRIDLRGSTIIFKGKSILFDTSFITGSPVVIENGRIEMIENNEQQIAINFKNVAGGYVKNITCRGGAYGIRAVESHSYQLDTFIHHNPKKVGFYHQGDGGAELNLRDVTITFANNFSGDYGIEIARTTLEDVGGYYLHNCLVVKNKAAGGLAKQGIYIHGPSGRSTTVFNLIGGGADGFDISDAANGNFALKLENVANNRFSASWITSVKLINIDNVSFSNMNIPYGFHFDGYINAFIAGVIQCGEYTAFNFSDTANVNNFYYSNIRPWNGSLANNYTHLTKNADQSSRTVYVDRFTSKGALTIADSSDPTNKIHVRLNQNNEFVLLDQTFTKTILSIDKNSVLRLQGAVDIGGNQVLGKRKTGWQIPRGTGGRGDWDSESATVKDVARTLKTLIEDLFGHGTIGN